MERRAVEIKGPEGAIDQWHMECPTCPKWKHEDALEIPRTHCVGGIITSMQGAIPLRWCAYAYQGTNFDTPDGPHIQCKMDTPNMGIQGPPKTVPLE